MLLLSHLRSALALFLAAALVAACGDDAPVELPMTPEPVVNSFTASASTVMSGGSVDLDWSTTDATGVRITADPGGEIASSTEPSGSVSSPALTADTTFTLEATAGEKTARSTVTVTVQAVAGPMPTIDTFTVSPDPVMFNGTVTLAWTTSDAETVRLTVDGTEVVSGAAMAAAGSAMVTADQPEGLLALLEATNAEGTVSQSLPINVIPPPGLEVEPNDDAQNATELDMMGLATARLGNPSDVDFFSVDVVEGGWIRAETSDGMGGCAVDQDMELRDGSGMVLAAGRFGNLVRDNMGQATGACRLIDPRSAAGARNLAAGTYYVRVSSGMFTPPTGDYTLQVTTGGPGCGNGIIETGEQCDDGGTAPGDGCSPTCEATVAGTAASGDAGRTTVSGALAAGASNLVQIDATGPGTLVAEVGVPVLGDCQEPTRLELLDSSFAPLGAVDGIQLQQGVFPCGRIDPARTAMLAAIPAAGTYYVRALPLDGTAAVPGHQLTVQLYGNGCGNGYRDGMEACDDGNQVDGDRCSNACTLNPLPADGLQTSLPLGTSFDPFFRIRVQTTMRGSLTATVTSAGTSTTGACGTPSRMGLIRPTDMVQVIGLSAGAQCGGIQHPEAAYAADLAPGTYDMVALNSGFGPGADVTVTSRVVPVACGNGIVERSGGEGCDDGNTVDTDACRNDCTANRTAAVPEMEPNDQPNEATPVMVTPSGAITSVSAGFSTAMDVDVYAFDLPANASFYIETYTDEGDPSSCRTVDTILTVIDPAGSTGLAENDDRGDLCSRLDSASVPALQNLPAGRYLFAVRPFQGTTPGPYRVDVVIR